MKLTQVSPFLDLFSRVTPNNYFCSNVRPIHSNSGPALSLNPTLTIKWSSFKFHRIFKHPQSLKPFIPGMLNKCTPATRNACKMQSLIDGKLLLQGLTELLFCFSYYNSSLKKGHSSSKFFLMFWRIYCKGESCLQLLLVWTECTATKR
jgi:hypothetical protein